MSLLIINIQKMCTFKTIYIYFVLIILILSCNTDDSGITEPIFFIQGKMVTSGIGTLKSDHQGQLYILFHEEKRHRDTHEAPDFIINISKEYIISNVGQDYYNRYFEYESSYFMISDYNPFHVKQTYQVIHNYSISIKDYYTNLLVSTRHDSIGTILDSYGIIPIVTDPTLGMPFKINDLMAAKIARINQLRSGLYPWHVTFRYTKYLNSYCWIIKNQTSPSSGNVYDIDAQTGEILSKERWYVVY